MLKIPNDQTTLLRETLTGAASILIVTRSNPTLDGVASCLALYLALSSQGKQVSLACPSAMTVEFNQLIGVDKVVTSIASSSGRNLVISFPYEEGSIEKVSYNIENNTFNLVIEPRENYPTITQDLIRYSSSGGGSFEAIITIDCAQLSDLEDLYTANQELFNKPLINIDYHMDNARFGKVNITDDSSSSNSEIITFILSTLGYNFDPDTATNLLAGLTSGSDNYTSPKTTANTFEAAAICLRSGARKLNFNNSRPLIPNMPAPPFSKPMKTPFGQPMMQPKNFGPKNNNMSFNKPAALPNQQPPKQSEAPPDWLKPKIYKGSTLL